MAINTTYISINEDFSLFVLAYLGQYGSTHWTDLFRVYTGDATIYSVPKDAVDTLKKLQNQQLIGQSGVGYWVLLTNSYS